MQMLILNYKRIKQKQINTIFQQDNTMQQKLLMSPIKLYYQLMFVINTLLWKQNNVCKHY